MNTLAQQTFKLHSDLGGGSVFENAVVTDCAFDNCSLSLTPDPKKRSVVRNVRATNCRTFNCVVGPALFEDVAIDGLRTGELLIVSGALFHHVTLKGEVGAVKLVKRPVLPKPDPELERPFH